MQFDDELNLDTLTNAKPDTLPKVALVNATSRAAKEGGQVGQFNVEGSATNFESFTAVPLQVSTSRQWFMGSGTSYFCRSDNSITPIKSDSNNYKQQGASCNTCPKAKWKGRTSPPDCVVSLDITFAGLSKDTPKGFCVSAKGASQKDMKLCLERMSDNGGITHNKVTIKAQKVKGKTFDYYVMTFTDIVPLTEEERTSILPLIEKHTPKAEKISLQAPETLEDTPVFSKDLVEIDLE